MKISKNLLFLAMLSLFSCSLFISCEPNPGDDTIGNWINWADRPGKARAEAVAFSIGDVGYVGTGKWNSSKSALSDFYSYSPTNDNWTQIASLPDSANRYSAVAFVVNNKGYVGLGQDIKGVLKSDFWVYDPINDTWSPLKPENTQLEGHEGPSARIGAVAFTIGSIGYVGTGNDGSDLSDIHAFDPLTNTWTRKAYYHNTVTDAVAFVIDGKAYLTTGKHGTAYNESFYCYDPEVDTWNALHPIYNTDNETFDDDYEIKRSMAVAFVVNNKAYVATGDYGGVRSDTWEYNPRTDRWIKKTSMEGENPSRKEAVSFVLANGRAYVATGMSGSSYSSDLWEFQPMADYNDSRTE